MCSSLLEECFEIVQEIRAQDESKNVASSLKPIYDRLSEIRKELEQLVCGCAVVAAEPTDTAQLSRSSPIDGVSARQTYGTTA